MKVFCIAAVRERSKLKPALIRNKIRDRSKSIKKNSYWTSIL